MKEIEIFKSEDNRVEVNVQFDGQTFWLSQSQISELFERDRTVITKHINNVFKEQELDEKSNVQKMHIPNSDKPITLYNLEVIISVGYRVNSKKGTQFRQWATQRLKEYLLKGYSVNQKRLDQLQQTIRLITESGSGTELQLNEAKGLLEIINNYTQSFIILNKFDSHTLETERLNENITYEIVYEEAIKAIAELKKQLIAKEEAAVLFGNEKDETFKSSLYSIVQTFDGQYLYPSIEEQAANLLYFVIKNHSFSDGNKRIGAFLFIWFLEQNKHRFKKSGELKINDNALVAIALLVAQSNPLEKDLMIKLIINLISD